MPDFASKAKRKSQTKKAKMRGMAGTASSVETTTSPATSSVSSPNPLTNPQTMPPTAA